MSSSTEEQRRMLRAAGWEFMRRNTKGHEMWRFGTFTWKIHNQSSDATNATRELKRLIERAAEKEKPVPVFNTPRLVPVVKQTVAPVPSVVVPKEEPMPAPSNDTDDDYRTRWTEKQDKELESCYRAKLTLDEMVQYMQDCRPGCTAAGIQGRAHHLRKRISAFGMHSPRLKEEVPALPASPPVAIVPPPAPTPAPTPPKTEGDMVRVVFEFGDKRRVIYVDPATAQEMLSAAASLA